MATITAGISYHISVLPVGGHSHWRLFPLTIQWPASSIFPFLVALVLILPSSLWSQSGRPLPGQGTGGLGGGSRSSGSNSSTGSGTQQQVQLPDTFGLFALYADAPLEETAFSDSLLRNFQQYDPTRRQVFDDRHLGILGSAHQPIVYQPWLRNGFSVGLRQYERYQINGRTMPYFRLQRPHTLLSYVQGSEQEDGYLTARFSRNFSDGINFVVDYSRISQIGTVDQYPNQQNRITAIATGLRRISKNGRYDSFLSFAANTTEHKDNGGIRIPPANATEFATPSSATVFLADARTRYAQRELMYTQYYRVGGGSDSTGSVRRGLSLMHQFVYNNATYKFRDAFATVDSFFYQYWYPALLPDDRGARYWIEHRLIENSFQLITYKPANNKPAKEAQVSPDFLRLGLTHKYNDLRQEPIDSLINNLLVTGKMQLSLGNRLRLTAAGQLDLWDQAGDYRVTGELFLDLKKAGNWRFRLNNQLYLPTLLQQQHWITQVAVWQNNDFSRTLETNLGAIYSLPASKLEIGGHYHLINNYIYFDTTGLPRQFSAALSILQLSLRKDFSLGPFILSNTLAWQNSSSEVLRLPAIFGKHSLFFDSRLFKNLEIQAGVDVRYTTSYFADYYNPLTGQFNRQDRQEVGFFPNADLFFSMKVTSFRAFVKWENATAAIRPGEWLQLTAFYPFPDAALRIGIHWRMLD
jgi:Putative porin